MPLFMPQTRFAFKRRTWEICCICHHMAYIYLPNIWLKYMVMTNYYLPIFKVVGECNEVVPSVENKVNNKISKHKYLQKGLFYCPSVAPSLSLHTCSPAALLSSAPLLKQIATNITSFKQGYLSYTLY